MTTHTRTICLCALLWGCGADSSPATTAHVAQPCQRNAQCEGGLVCMATALGGGRCTQPCAEGACTQGVCTRAHGWGTGDALCARSCAQDPCPSDLRCQGDVCVPDVTRPPPQALTGPDIERALGVVCDAQRVDGPGPSTWRMSFEWPQGAQRAWVAPFVREGTLEAQRLSWDEQSLSLTQTYNKHQFRRVEPPLNPQPAGTFANFSMDSPFLFPYAPQDRDLVVEGARYTLEVTAAQPPCLHVWFQRDARRVLALNVYIVDPAMPRAKDAPFDASVQEALSTMRRLLTPDGSFERVDVEFIDAPSELAQRRRVVRTDEDIRAITGLGRPRGPDAYWMHALDVFLVQGIEHPRLPGVLGYAASLPAAPGLQGNPLQGALFSSELLGVDDVAFGALMAHELGHLLGLRHTTELAHNGVSEAQRRVARLVGTTDPLVDTAVCQEPARLLRECPDAPNLMFPLLPESVAKAAALELSPAQKLVLTGAPQRP